MSGRCIARPYLHALCASLHFSPKQHRCMPGQSTAGAPPPRVSRSPPSPPSSSSSALKPLPWIKTYFVPEEVVSLPSKYRYSAPFNLSFPTSNLSWTYEPDCDARRAPQHRIVYGEQNLRAMDDKGCARHPTGLSTVIWPPRLPDLRLQPALPFPTQGLSRRFRHQLSSGA